MRRRPRRVTTTAVTSTRRAGGDQGDHDQPTLRYVPQPQTPQLVGTRVDRGARHRPCPGSSIDRHSNLRYPPFVPTVYRNVLLSIVAVALAFSSSGFLSLCVHPDHSGLELTWATCCATADCCEGEALEHESHEGQGAEGHDDGCRDYLLGSTQEWTPSSTPNWEVPVALLYATPSPWTFMPRVSWPQPIPPSGAPPPRRDLQTVVIRC